MDFGSGKPPYEEKTNEPDQQKNILKSLNFYIMNIEEIIKLLINGDTAQVKSHQKKEVQKRLREIKKNCTIVLSQLKEIS